MLAQTGAVKPYQYDTASTNMAPTSIAAAGGSQPHDNLQPSLAINFVICVQGGVYPVAS